MRSFHLSISLSLSLAKDNSSCCSVDSQVTALVLRSTHHSTVFPSTLAGSDASAQAVVSKQMFHLVRLSTHTNFLLFIHLFVFYYMLYKQTHTPQPFTPANGTKPRLVNTLKHSADCAYIPRSPQSQLKCRKPKTYFTPPHLYPSIRSHNADK